MNSEKKKKSTHPDWVTAHKLPHTEIKKINDKYYLYGAKSVYDKTTKRSRKVSLGIIGSITQERGFIPSEKKELKEKSKRTYLDKEVFALEYGLAKWLTDTLEQEHLLSDLQKHFPNLWQFIIGMIYTRIGYQSALKNIPFILEHSDLPSILKWDKKLTSQKISDMLFELGQNTKSIHEFLKPKGAQKRNVLMDATDIALQSNGISLAQKGYNAEMNFQSQFVLLYLYDAQSLKPLYYRLLPGNIREVSAMKNTVKISGLGECVYIADKGFFSESNISGLERLKMEYIIPLRRDNALIPYQKLQEIELTEGYFEYAKRFVFHTESLSVGKRRLELFLDGKLKEQEKFDYLQRIHTLPEEFSKADFNAKANRMGTFSVLHNTNLSPKEVYREYKSRGQVEQFFDHLKNTLDASCSYMQREESLNGWMFINHLSMRLIYLIHQKLKTTPMNKKQMMSNKYSIADTIEHFKSIKKIKFSPSEFIFTEQNKLTKTLLQKLNISIT